MGSSKPEGSLRLWKFKESLGLSLRIWLTLATLPLATTYVLTSHLLEILLAPKFATPDRKSVVLITGCSSGIGRAAALKMAQLGYTVFGGVRSQADANNLTQTNVIPIILDVTNADHITAAVKTISEYLTQNGVPLAAIVNNAGITEASAFENLDVNRHNLVMRVNLNGVMDLTRAFLPLVRQYRARILVVGSMHGRLTWAGWSGYIASKWGIKGWTLALKQELEPLGVSVSLIEVGHTATEIGRKSAQGLMLTKQHTGGTHAHNAYAGLEKMTELFVGEESNAAAGKPENTTNCAIEHAIVSRYPQSVYLPSTKCILAAIFAALPQPLAPIRLFSQGYRIKYGLRNGWLP